MNNINTNAQNERRDIMKGIDVSSYQGAIDWGKVKWAGVQFAILKIIRKDLNPDKTFEQNWKGCTEAGMPIQGVYNYSYATTLGKAKTDAQRVIEVLAGRKTFVWLDVEDRCQQGLGQTLIDIINTYQSEIKAAGLDFGVYTGLSFYNTYILPYANQINCPFWIARYPSTKGMTIGDDPNDAKKPAIVHSLYGWQYTSAFTCSGLNNSTDANLLYVELGAKDTTATSQPAPAPAKPSDESWKGNVDYYLESEEVRKWQHAMNVGFDLKGADALKEDGKFGADSQAFAKSHNLWSGQKHNCPTAIKWLRRTLHDVYSFTKLDTDYGKWTDYLSKCVKVFQKNRGLTQDAYVGLLTTYRLLKG
jgi:GH25 family lysozyme M1 (1,4-beta-N-acetylmuramidase)